MKKSNLNIQIFKNHCKVRSGLECKQNKTKQFLQKDFYFFFWRSY